jgi:hypothetical protein
MSILSWRAVPRATLRATLRVVLALTLAAAVMVPLAEDASAAAGCVSNADYRRLAQGQSLRHVRRVAGDDAQVSMRRWTQYGHRYQERLYHMCHPWNSRYHTLTTRFTVYGGQWRAYLVDLHVGPER